MKEGWNRKCNKYAISSWNHRSCNLLCAKFLVILIHCWRIRLFWKKLVQIIFTGRSESPVSFRVSSEIIEKLSNLNQLFAPHLDYYWYFYCLHCFSSHRWAKWNSSRMMIIFPVFFLLLIFLVIFLRFLIFQRSSLIIFVTVIYYSGNRKIELNANE